jgi:hypothetical protein
MFFFESDDDCEKRERQIHPARRINQAGGDYQDFSGNDFSCGQR